MNQLFVHVSKDNPDEMQLRMSYKGLTAIGVIESHLVLALPDDARNKYFQDVSKRMRRELREAHRNQTQPKA